MRKFHKFLSSCERDKRLMTKGQYKIITPFAYKEGYYPKWSFYQFSTKRIFQIIRLGALW